MLTGLVLLAVIDARTLRLPNRLTLPLLTSGLAWSALMIRGIPVDAILGAILGYAVFAGLGWAFFRLRGAEGLGLGDAKLLAAGGAWAGATALPWIVLCAALPALVAALVGPGRGRPLAFGPWLAAAIFAVWCWRTTQAI